MQRNEYEHLRTQVEQAYQDALAEATRERQENLDALDRVWKLANRENFQIPGNKIDQEPSHGDNKVAASPTPETHRNEFSVIDSVREILDELPIPFVSRDVLFHLRRKFPNAEINKTTIAGTLKRLAEANDIYLLEQGSGRRPSLYTKENKEDAVIQNGE